MPEVSTSSTTGRPAAEATVSTSSTTDTSTTDSPTTAPVAAKAAGEVTLEQLRNAWPEVLESVQKTKMSAWAVVYTATARALDGDVLTLSFVSQADVDSFKQPQGSGEGVSEVLRRAIVEVLGLRVKFIAKADASAEPPAAAPTTSVTPPVSEKDAQGWAVAEIPGAEPPAPAPAAKASAASSEPAKPADKARYGESVVRELLGASFIEEQDVAPRVVPRPADD